LDHPPRGSSAGTYQVRRAGRGLVRLTTPTGLRPYDIEVGGAGLRMDSGLELSFRDTRHPEWTGSGRDLVSAPAGWNGSGGPGGGSSAATSPDEWTGSGGWSGAADWSGSGMPTITTPPPPVPPHPGYDEANMPTKPMNPAAPPSYQPPQPPPQSDDPWLV
jgi:hypothetical protein